MEVSFDVEVDSGEDDENMPPPAGTAETAAAVEPPGVIGAANQLHPNFMPSSTSPGGGSAGNPALLRLAPTAKNKSSFAQVPFKNIHSSHFLSPEGSLVRLPNVIVMVGLPARGKTYISRKLCRYLNWIGIRTKAFNLGDYRRHEYTYKDCDIFRPDSQLGARIRELDIRLATIGKPNAFNIGDYRRDQVGGQQDDFFNARNPQAMAIRLECARRALIDMCQFLQWRGGEGPGGEVAVFDATNTTRERRRMVLQECTEVHKFRVMFVESVCTDPRIIESNIHDVKVNSPDYANMDREKAKNDFLKRIKHYEDIYEPIDEQLESDLSFIRVINAGKSYYVHNVNGHIQSRVVYFLMNIHLMQRSIFITRHGESEYNKMGRLGGDSPLSTAGDKYADKLAEYFEQEKVPDMRVWCSQKLRAVQTASRMRKTVSGGAECWKALDEIDAGICEGLTYEEIAQRYPQQLDNRDQDKYHYRYPSGESYEDLVARLEPVIMELERQSNVLVVSHQAVLRCILAYFLDKNRDELPYLRVPLHSVVKLTPIAYGCRMDTIKFDVDAADTYRGKPPPGAEPTANRSRPPTAPTSANTSPRRSIVTLGANSAALKELRRLAQAASVTEETANGLLLDRGGDAQEEEEADDEGGLRLERALANAVTTNMTWEVRHIVRPDLDRCHSPELPESKQQTLSLSAGSSGLKLVDRRRPSADVDGDSTPHAST